MALDSLNCALVPHSARLFIVVDNGYVILYQIMYYKMERRSGIYKDTTYSVIVFADSFFVYDTSLFSLAAKVITNSVTCKTESIFFDTFLQTYFQV